ncbi:MAG: hypothetical protein IIC59_14425 [Proteobacteria bacterium]|nr:hypothetical protein [Pseudomonadota bacterium]
MVIQLPKTNFPLIIHARSASETCDEQPNMLFMGSYKWHTPSQKVPVLPSPVWIVASGHTSCWMSKAPMRIVGGQVTASMVPATQIQISRLATTSKIADEAWVEVGFASYKQLIPLRSSLIMRNGRTFAASNGRAVVPRGKFTVKALGKSGEPLWSRSLTADKPFQSVELEN